MHPVQPDHSVVLGISMIFCMLARRRKEIISMFKETLEM
jgi:hypothetical protein